MPSMLACRDAHRFIGVAAPLSTILLLFGCGVAPMAEPQVPDEARLVGGGQAFEFVAPTRGILFVVDANDGQLLGSKSMEPGEDVSVEPDEMREMIAELKSPGAGDKVKSPRPLLYFASLEKLGLFVGESGD